MANDPLTAWLLAGVAGGTVLALTLAPHRRQDKRHIIENEGILHKVS